MKTLIAETVQVHSAARKPDSCSDRRCSRTVSAFRCALLVLLALGLLGGIGQAQDALVIDPNGGVRVAKTLSVTGDIGIGVNSGPHFPLTIRGKYSYSNLLMFQDSNGVEKYAIGLGDASSLDNKVIGFNLVEGYSTRLFIQTETGNVGIGTKGPKAKLHIHGDSNNSGAGGFALDASDDSNPEKFILRINPFKVGNDPKRIGYQFQAKSAEGGTNVPLTFDNAGNVGIGKTPDANAKLDVAGGANFSGNVGIGAGDILIDGVQKVAHVAINAYLDAENKWQIKDKTKKAAAIALLDSGEIRLYATKTDGATDWQEIGINGERAPLRFKIPLGGSVDKEIGPVCGTANGCRVDLLMRKERGAGEVIVATELVFCFPNRAKCRTASNLWGWSGIHTSNYDWTFSNEGDTVFKIWDDWCQAKVIRDWNWKYSCDPDVQADVTVLPLELRYLSR